MKKTLLIVIFSLICLSAQARTCTVPKTCGNTVGCISVLKGFPSYLAFNNWLAVNPYVEYDVVFVTSTNITIVLWTNNCVYTEQCWDQTGNCGL